MEEADQLPAIAMCSRTSDYQAACTIRREEKSRTVITLIGERLYIDGFVYAKNYQEESGNVYWECVRYRRGGAAATQCHARAWTSDPTFGENIILFNGPRDSEHNHLPKLADREEAEALEGLNKNKNFESKHDSDQNCKDAEFDSNEEAHSKIERKKSESFDATEEMESVDEDAEISVANSQSSVARATPAIATREPKVIGSRFFIDGFSYHRTGSNSDSTRLYWQCKQYHTRRCYATAITSNPLVNCEMIVYKGPEESRHNHRPNFSEEAVEFGSTKKKAKSKFVDQVSLQPIAKNAASFAETEEYEKFGSLKMVHSDRGEKILAPDGSNKKSSSEFELQVRKSSRIAQQMEVDEVVPEGASSRPARSSARGISYVIDSDDSDDDPDPSQARLIGRRLCIGRYTYKVNQYNSDDKVTWECIRYRAQGCHARAITSDPSSGEKLTLYKGPDTSRHDHFPSRSDIDKAKKLLKLGSKTRIPEKRRIQVVRPIRVSTDTDLKKVRPSVHHLSNPSEPGIAEANDNFVGNLSTDGSGLQRETPTSGVPFGNNSNTSCSRLIGKRLYIDGYIYSARNYYETSTSWVCPRSRRFTSTCSAKATTSNPLKGGKLIVYRGPNESEHNHPPNPGEVRRAEIIASRLEKEMQFTRRESNKSHELVKDSLSSPSPISEKGESDSLKQSLIQRSDSRDSTVSSTQKLVARRDQRCKAKRRGPRSLLSDASTYRIFLKRFLKQPIFDRKNVTKALRSVFTSDIGCSIAYGIVFVNRSKIEKDLEAMKSNPRAIVTALNGNRLSHLRRDKNPEENIDSKKMKQGRTSGRTTIIRSSDSSFSDEQCQTASEKNISDKARRQVTSRSPDKQSVFTEYYHEPSRMGLSVGEPFKNDNRIENSSEPASLLLSDSPDENQLDSRPFTSTINSNRDEFSADLRVEKERLSTEEEMIDEESSIIISPSTTAIPMNEKNVFPIRSPWSTLDSSSNEPKVNQEIAFVDLTENFDVKPKCLTYEEQISQESLQENGPACSQTYIVPSICKSDETEMPEEIPDSDASLGISDVKIEPPSH